MTATGRTAFPLAWEAHGGRLGVKPWSDYGWAAQAALAALLMAWKRVPPRIVRVECAFAAAECVVRNRLAGYGRVVKPWFQNLVASFSRGEATAL